MDQLAAIPIKLGTVKIAPRGTYAIFIASSFRFGSHGILYSPPFFLSLLKKGICLCVWFSIPFVTPDLMSLTSSLPIRSHPPKFDIFSTLLNIPELVYHRLDIR